MREARRQNISHALLDYGVTCQKRWETNDTTSSEIPCKVLARPSGAFWGTCTHAELETVISGRPALPPESHRTLCSQCFSCMRELTISAFIEHPTKSRSVSKQPQGKALFPDETCTYRPNALTIYLEVRTPIIIVIIIIIILSPLSWSPNQDTYLLNV